MIVKIKNTTSGTGLFSVRAYANAVVTDSTTEERVFLALNEEHTFTVPLGSDNIGVCIRKRNQNNSYPDKSDSYYDWGNCFDVEWKINSSTEATFLIPYADGQMFSGIFDATQNYATQV